MEDTSFNYIEIKPAIIDKYNLIFHKTYPVQEPKNSYYIMVNTKLHYKIWKYTIVTVNEVDR